MKRFEAFLSENQIEYRLEESVASRSTFKIGGTVAIAVFPSSVDELCLALRFAYTSGIKYEIVGNASNILFAFERYNGAIFFTSKINRISFDKTSVYAECGASLTRLADACAKASLSGLEFAYGIPGRIGGSVYMNAGAHGSSVSEVLEYSDAFDVSTGERIRITEHFFGYRKSIYMEKKELVCLGAKFHLKSEESGKIFEVMHRNTEKRRASQPLEFPSAGSYFKRPENDFAGRLIEECGLKGERIGGAEVSTKHAGFIINVGGAVYTDVLSLEEKIKERVLSRFGVELSREVRLIEDKDVIFNADN